MLTLITGKFTRLLFEFACKENSHATDAPIIHDTGAVFPELQPVPVIPQENPPSETNPGYNKAQEPLFTPIEPQTEPLVVIPPEFWTYIPGVTDIERRNDSTARTLESSQVADNAKGGNENDNQNSTMGNENLDNQNSTGETKI